MYNVRPNSSRKYAANCTAESPDRKADMRFDVLQAAEVYLYDGPDWGTKLTNQKHVQNQDLLQIIKQINSK